ncbi:MAG: type VI secretion system baseplate subunit TssE [Paracoccaceae bacterium]
MADKTIIERLQPSLLDRLTDNESDQITERREDRVIDVRELREIIQRDLGWLLNTNNAETIIDAEVYPNIATSVLNYGVRDVTGDYSNMNKAEAIRRAISEAIETFEPRILPGSVEVEMRLGKDASGAIIQYDIHADMWAQPLPMELYLRSEVDVTTGEFELERVG